MEQPKERVNINIQDILAGANIMKVAIERGAFKAEEISQVGMMFDKYNAFINQYNEDMKAQEQMQQEQQEQLEEKSEETPEPAKKPKKK